MEEKGMGGAALVSGVSGTLWVSLLAAIICSVSEP